MALLRIICRKTFSWVQELSYDMVMAPMSKERRTLLRDLAATCQSTFDVDPAVFRKLFYSAEDIDALLSCAFFIYTLHPSSDCMLNCCMSTAVNTYNSILSHR